MENKNPTLLDLMLVHHGLLEVLFSSLKDNIGMATKKEFVSEMIDEFQWELEKHFFVEEKVIFKSVSQGQPEIYKIVVQLLEEHDAMMKMLEETKSQLKENLPVDLSKFGHLLTEHRMIEEHKLYPDLDNKIDEEEKKLIISRINQLPLVKTFG